MKVLVGDIGGTNSRFSIGEAEDGSFSVSIAQVLLSAEHATFDSALKLFLDSAGDEVKGLDAVCFAIAGPVEGDCAKVTNLPWEIEAVKLKGHLDVGHIFLINDFEAIGWGLEGLEDKDLCVLQEGWPIDRMNRALIGAGTGLGQSLMTWSSDYYLVHPTEGGHTDFAPQDEVQIALLEYMQEQYRHVSYERLLSGSGLVEIFSFLRKYRRQEPTAGLLTALSSEDPAAAISRSALNAEDSIATEALDMFVSIYGAQAGNLALSCMPRGGLFVAGGIAAKILPRMTAGGFMQAFLHKGRMQGLLQKIPVNIVLDHDIGLRGAAFAAWHMSQ